MAAAEVQAKVLALLDPCPSSSCLGQVLQNDMLMLADLTLGRFCLLWGLC
jgi:hypothetical protein